MLLYTLLMSFLMFGAVFLLNLLILFCQVMREQEEQAARQRRKNIFDKTKGGG